MSAQLGLPYERFARASRRSAMISLFGFIVIFAALGYSAYQLQHLSKEVDKRSAELASLNERITQAQRELAVSLQNADSIKQQLALARTQLRASREAVSFVTTGINLYHSRMYERAVEAYNEALRLDPRNPYIANLKGYSLFKANRLEEAIRTLRHSVEVDPTYAWGFFDLARVLCANKEFSNAEDAALSGITLRPGLKDIMLSDGEFARLCKPILSAIKGSNK